jgi:hypothetical protein
MLLLIFLPKTYSGRPDPSPAMGRHQQQQAQSRLGAFLLLMRQQIGVWGFPLSRVSWLVTMKKLRLSHKV